MAPVCCDKTAEVRIMQFSLKCSPMSAKFDDEIRRGSHRSGAQTGVGWFSTSDAISRKWCKIELRMMIINH